MKIEDNYLDQEKFDELQTFMLHPDFAWYFRHKYYAKIESVGSPSLLLKHSSNDLKEENVLDQFQFVHPFYSMDSPRSPFMNQMIPILEIMNPISIMKIAANLLTRLPTLVENSFHADIEDMLEEKQKQWTTSIFYMNTNNGYTLFEDGTKVESVANRMLTFPAHMRHTGTTCTDQQIRIVINFNYFSRK